jgi:hypothetical protein
MSASARLNRLTRSPLVTGNRNEKLPPRTTQGMQSVQRPIIQEKNAESQKNGPVNTMQILTWHEQRLNKMNETLKNLDTSTDNNQVISQLIDTIGIIDNRMTELSKLVVELKNKNRKNELEIVELTKKQVESEVKQEVKSVNEESLKEEKVVLTINE